MTPAILDEPRSRGAGPTAQKIAILALHARTWFCIVGLIITARASHRDPPLLADLFAAPVIPSISLACCTTTEQENAVF
jgi:hypothetical protein